MCINPWWWGIKKWRQTLLSVTQWQKKKPQAHNEMQEIAFQCIKNPLVYCEGFEMPPQVAQQSFGVSGCGLTQNWTYSWATCSSWAYPEQEMCPGHPKRPLPAPAIPWLCHRGTSRAGKRQLMGNSYQRGHLCCVWERRGKRLHGQGHWHRRGGCFIPGSTSVTLARSYHLIYAWGEDSCFHFS